jgi:predicted secreted hydrolase
VIDWRRLFPLVLAAAALPGCGRTPEPAHTPDLAVLAQAAQGFAQAQPGRVLRFPQDHGPHPDFRIEWWYLTANLEDPEGRPYGAQWTLFRLAARAPGSLPPESPWQNGQVYMAHMAITTPERHAAFQRYARGGDHQGLAQAGVTAKPFRAWLDDWRMASVEPEETASWLPLEVRARQDGFAIQLRLESDRPPVLQGEAGFSAKSLNGGGSFYYSQPFLQAAGELTFAGKPVQVKGLAWLDREWSSQFLRPDQVGWDWFALHLESGEKLMLFQMRQASAGSRYRHAALISPGGRKTDFGPDQVRMEVVRTERVAGRTLPLGWRVVLPGAGRVLRIDALHAGQWLDVDFPYWEGVVTVAGEGPENRGVGYMELTGYAPD